jgi:hypothetical protein
MAHAERKCSTCEGPYRPRDKAAADRGTCWPCHANVTHGIAAPSQRTCKVCTSVFVVPKDRPDEKHCSTCRRLVARPIEDNPFADFASGTTTTLPQAETHTLAPPLTQAVFDLETFSLDRGWGVTMVGSILIHGPGGAKMQTFTLRESSTWPGVRSNDAELGAKILNALQPCHVLYAHNGSRFDIPWLNSVALKYGMPSLVGKKLIDPCSVAFRNYRIGRNSLGNLADFLGLEEQKMPVSIEVWKSALFDNDDECWQTLVARCESDVRVLNAVAARVTRDVGMIDGKGSAR